MKMRKGQVSNAITDNEFNDAFDIDINNQSNFTPMMNQYLTIKNDYKDCLLFYRMGDFYELFFDDAIKASYELDIVLTKRGKVENQNISMCGVPYHASQSYISKLIKKGYKVAICEQIESVEEAKKRGYKSIVKRDVVRIITPGTLIDEEIFVSDENNFICSISRDSNTKDNIFIALVDISTSEFILYELINESIESAILKFQPKEIIVSMEFVKDYNEIFELCQRFKITLTKRANNIFDFDRCMNILTNYYKVISFEGIVKFTENEISAAGSLFDYLIYTQKNNLPKIHFPKKIYQKHCLKIDQATRLSLEIDRNIRENDYSMNLLKVIDMTKTLVGSRLLKSFLLHPLSDLEVIEKRLNIVEYFLENAKIREKSREKISLFPDIERAFAKITSNKASAKDFIKLRDGIQICMSIANLIYLEKSPKYVSSIADEMISSNGLLQELKDCFVPVWDEKNANTNNVDNNTRNSFVRIGYIPQLDELYRFKIEFKSEIFELREKYINLTGIQNLKILYNKIFGYFIEVSNNNIVKMEKHEVFICKQTLVNSARYITEELKNLESKFIQCEDNISLIESNIIEKLTSLVRDESEYIQICSHAMAKLDVFSSFAELAYQKKYVRPKMTNEFEINIQEGWHPFVKINNIHTEKIITNNLCIGENNYIHILTGPNMAGKSTFLRQNAIICLIAHIGSFVPAKNATISVLDGIFSRVGSSDNISSGQSTFMVEMLETAYILNNASNKSFIILDEIGRGTSSSEGIAIAEAITEDIYRRIGAKTIFATHYHEIVQHLKTLPKIEEYTMQIEENEGKITFMHKVINGSIKKNKSYGIYVASIAGISVDIIKRAEEILKNIQK